MRLVVIAGPDKGRSFALDPSGPLLLGRGKAVEIRLGDPSISKVHCRLTWDGQPLTVADQGSSFGTFVNDQRVTQQPLRPGDVIRVGASQLRLEGDAGPGEEAEEQTTYLVPPSPAPAGDRLAEL
jgi:pSer/pThr/pTyr-binding forkhead associated (FHA) protein